MLRNTRLQRNEHQGIKMNDYGAFGDVHILTTTRNALIRSKKLYVRKFYRIDTLSCGSNSKSSSASIILGILNKVRSKPRRSKSNGVVNRLSLSLLCTGLPKPIERNPSNCVRLSSVSKLSRTQSDGLSSIEFDFFGNRTH